MTCKKCGANFQGNFCPDCGTPVPKSVTCKHCGTEYAGNFCPDCGKTNQNFFQRWNKPVESLTPKQRLGYFLFMFSMIGVLFLLIMSLMSNPIPYPTDDSPQSQTNTSNGADVVKTSEAIKITPAELIKAYQDNEIKASELYLNKTLEITRVVNDIGVNVLNENYVTIGKNTDAFIDTVMCKLLSEQSIDPAGLEKGVTITIQGIYSKSLLGVTLSKCTINRVY